MAINTNGWTIYAPEGASLEQIAEAFENDVNLWTKVTGSKTHTYRGQSPRDWVLQHSAQHLVYTRGRDTEKIKRNAAEWSAERIVCECGRAITRGKLARHKTTTAHTQGLAAQAES